MAQSTNDKGGGGEETLAFHYIKSNYFRVIHADGIHGGVTPKLKIQMAFFSERNPIPQTTVHGVSETSDGVVLKDEIRSKRVTKSGIIREVEAEILMDLETAKALYKWLDEKIKIIETIPQEPTKSG